MSVETLTAIAGAILSLAFSYLPGLNRWYQALDGTAKRLLMLAVLTVTAFAVYALACTPYAGLLQIPLTCDAAGAISLLRLLLSALIANQAVYSLTPRSDGSSGEGDETAQGMVQAQ